MGSRRDHAATWLQAKGWRQNYHGNWQHDTLSPHGALDTDQAVRAQTRADRVAATAARDHSMAVVAENAGDEWMDAALAAVRETAGRMAEFTTDDVMDGHPDLPEPHNPRAWGPVMVRAKADGVIENTGFMAPSSRVSSHGRRKLLWRSLVFGQVPTMQLAEVVRNG